MRRRLDGRLGFGGEADACRPVGERHEVLAADDVLDLLQPFQEEGQDGFAGQLALLELADHASVVRRGKSLLSRDERRERRHLRLDVVERRVGSRGELRRRDVHAALLQGEGVLLRRQTEVRPGPRQDLGTDETLVVGELLPERPVGGLVARDLVLVEELGDAVDQEGLIRQVLLHLDPGREDQAGHVQPLARPLLSQLRDGRVAGIEARIPLQAHEGLGPARRGDLIVEEAPKAAKDEARDVVVGHFVLFLEEGPADRVLLGLDQDLEVLPHERIGLLGEARLEHADRLLRSPANPLGEARLQVHDPVVQPVDANAAIGLRSELRLGLQDDPRVLVAARDPGRCFGLVRSGGRRGEEESEDDWIHEEPPARERHRQFSGLNAT